MCDIYIENNFDDYTNLEDCSAVHDIYALIYPIVVYPMYLLQVVLFPFYIYVNRINRRRDEKVVIFPITNVFYKMVIFMLFVVVAKYIFFISIHVAGVLTNMRYTLYEYVSFFAYEFCLLLLRVNNAVFHLLLIITPIVRFLVYFFPSTEKPITVANTHIYKILAYLYVILIIKNFFYFFMEVINEDPVVELELTGWEWINYIPYVPFYSFHVLIFLSVLLYIPIMINIRKHSHLASYQQNHPQRYIFWQTVVVFIFKSMTLPIIILYKYFSYNNFVRLTSEETAIEEITIPLIIVLSYLGYFANPPQIMCDIYTENHFDDYTNIEDCSIVYNIYDRFYPIVLIPMHILHIILLPLYIYVNRINRRRDEKVVIFPITNVFYKMVISMFFVVVVEYLVSIAINLIFFLPDVSETLYLIIPVIFHECCALLLSVNNTVFHLLLIMSAIVRFLIYFFPSTEKPISVMQAHIYKVLAVLYVILIIKSVFHEIFDYIIGDLLSNGWDLTGLDWVGYIPYVSYYSFHVLIFLSALLYIPIMIKIRKHSHLASFQQNNPQRYIFWQTVVVFMFKSMTLPKIIMYKYFSFNNLLILTSEETAIEQITIPLVIELSYLGCNKRNVTAAFSSFKHFLKNIFGRDSVTVQPQVVPISSINVSN